MNTTPKAETPADTLQFLRDIDRHELRILRDDGIYRHLRAKRPGDSCYWFDIVTWPGALAYTGDMGSFTFRRLEDMFEFFRGAEGPNLYRFDRRYWAEKCAAADKHDGIEEFDAGKFKDRVLEAFEQSTEDWPIERRELLRAELVDDVLGCEAVVEHENEYGALGALYDFGFEYTDDSGRRRTWRVEVGDLSASSYRSYNLRFTWFCHAVRWAIAAYDRAKEAQVKLATDIAHQVAEVTPPMPAGAEPGPSRAAFLLDLGSDA